MKTKQELRKEFDDDITNYITLNKLCDLCKSSKKCYRDYRKICLKKRLAIEMTIYKVYIEQEKEQ